MPEQREIEQSRQSQVDEVIQDGDSSTPALYSKEWVRQNWDYERDQGPALVQIVKLIHEVHITIPGLVAASVVYYSFWSVDAPTVKTLAATFGTFGTTTAMIFSQWWCSTLIDGYDD